MANLKKAQGRLKRCIAVSRDAMQRTLDQCDSESPHLFDAGYIHRQLEIAIEQLRMCQAIVANWAEASVEFDEGEFSEG